MTVYEDGSSDNRVRPQRPEKPKTATGRLRLRRDPARTLAERRAWDRSIRGKIGRGVNVVTAPTRMGLSALDRGLTSVETIARKRLGL